MAGIVSNSGLRFNTRFKHLDARHFQKLVDSYDKFMKMSQDPKVQSARYAKEIKALKIQFKKTPTEQLGKIIQEKEQERQFLTERMSKFNQGYFSLNEHITTRTEAFLGQYA